MVKCGGRLVVAMREDVTELLGGENAEKDRMRVGGTWVWCLRNI